MWPETSSSVPWDPPRGSSVPQAETPTRHLARPEHRKPSPENASCNDKKSNSMISGGLEREMRGQKEIDETQAPMQETSVKKTTVINQPNDSKEGELDDIWMKFVFGGNGEDEDIEYRTSAAGELHTMVDCVSSSSLRANPPSEIPEYFSNTRKRQEDSPTFSTLVHKSNDSQSPLQPKYINSGRRNLIERHHEHAEHAASDPQLCNHSSLSVCGPLREDSEGIPILHTRHQDGGHHGRSYMHRNNDSGRYSWNAHSQHFKPSYDTPSSELESVSMVAIANSQACSPTSPNKSPISNAKRKVVFEMPRPFSG
jgi:hypothetical protein